jgi:hypothetical protein
LFKKWGIKIYPKKQKRIKKAAAFVHARKTKKQFPNGFL